MPLVIKDYNWEETPKSLAITVPLKGVKKDKVDIFSTDELIKASFPPYLFEVFLRHPVDEDKSVARIENGVLLFQLAKQTEQIWGQLCSDVMDDKVKLREMKEAALIKAQQKAEEEAKKRAEKKREFEKHALTKAMDLDAEERDRIAAIKNAEKEQATRELEIWKEEQRQIALQEKKQLEEEARKQKELFESERRRKKLEEKSKRAASIFQQENQADGDNVRQNGKISVNFTPRVFPTAMRESTKQLEDEWLKKQAEAQRTAEIEDSDLSEEERNPQFMKEKGDHFFRNGDLQAAINAYTHAIRLSKGKMPSVYSNRAACHLMKRNLIKSVEDSSKALELLTPAVEMNAQSRFKAHVRRGTAFCELELYVEGLQDYNAALKIDPTNEQIQADIDKIKYIIQSGDTPSQT